MHSVEPNYARQIIAPEASKKNKLFQEPVMSIASEVITTIDGDIVMAEVTSS